MAKIGDRQEREELHALDALEPDEAWAVEASREADRDGGESLDWVPLTWSSLPVDVVLPLAMNQASALRELRFLVEPGEEERVVVLMQRTETGWSTHLPTPTRRDTVSALRSLPSGERVVYVRAGPGEQWALVLAPETLQIDWSAPEAVRWRPLWDMIGRDEVRAGLVRLA